MSRRSVRSTGLRLTIAQAFRKIGARIAAKQSAQMPRDGLDDLWSRHVGSEDWGDGENGLRQFRPVRVLFANRDNGLRVRVGRRPAGAEGTRAAQAIGDPARDREGEQAGRLACREALAQRIDETLDNLLRSIRADLMASVTDGRVANARHRLIDIRKDLHSRELRQ